MELGIKSICKNQWSFNTIAKLQVEEKLEIVFLSIAAKISKASRNKSNNMQNLYRVHNGTLLEKE